MVGKFKLATMEIQRLGPRMVPARSLRRSWVKASGRARCEWAVWSHLYRSGELRVVEMIVLDGVWTPIMPLPILFHGDVGGGQGCIRSLSRYGGPDYVPFL